MSFINGFISTFVDFWAGICNFNLNLEFLGRALAVVVIGIITTILLFIIVGFIAVLIFNDNDHNDYML